MTSITKLLLGESHSGDALRYESDSASQHSGAALGRGPVVVWNATRRCNLRCRHCYINAHDGADSGELTGDEARALIDDLAAMRCPALLFSGGEPLLRDDLCALMAYASGRGVRPALSTNGTLITPQAAQRIHAAGVSYVGISLDGAGDANDDFRGQRGAYDAALAGIRNCAAVGQRVGLRVTLSRHTLDAIDDMFDLLVDEPISRVCFYHLVPTGRASAALGNEMLTPGQTRRAVDLIARRTLDLAGLDKEVLTVDNHADGVYLYLNAKRAGKVALAGRMWSLLARNGGNRSGQAFGAIGVDGSVYADQFTRNRPLGNVRERPFSAIWRDDANPLLRDLRRRRELLAGRCAACRFVDVCNGNFRARAEALTGDFWACDPACYLTDDEIGGELR